MERHVIMVFPKPFRFQSHPNHAERSPAPRRFSFSGGSFPCQPKPKSPRTARIPNISTGPKTAEGKEAICFNNLRHGLAGAFHLLPWENEDDFSGLQLALRAEHNPQTPTEQILVDRMAQHEWLRQRALNLQNSASPEDGHDLTSEKEFALYLRYQTTHERAFHKCLSDLLKLRAEKSEKHKLALNRKKRQKEAEARK